ncbi:MAG: sulfatase-like hydrolase/transferase, partial [Acidobacteria bacterium]|nr:sulfatase-like hydrolase/transferase [Acidobacteriota bacterium]
GPLRGIKRDVYDGGIREPFIAWWPDRVKPGVSRHVSAFQDVTPTLAELAGTSVPAGIDGISMAPALLRRGGQRQHDYFYWEYVGGKAGSRQSCLEIATGWKGVRYGSKGTLELYNMNRDLAEKSDGAKQHPDVVARLTRYLDTVRTPSAIFPMPERGRKPRREDSDF